jgi:hypothetical protein
MTILKNQLRALVRTPLGPKRVISVTGICEIGRSSALRTLKEDKKITDKNIIDNRKNLVLCFMVLVFIFIIFIIYF